MPPTKPDEVIAELRRLREDEDRTKNWKRWGPYLSERQWGTVREDYSADGNCWAYFPHDHARSRAYRWGEDGLLGICDRECRLCFALALWNGKDPILKERLFGLTGPEGNHGEDVKEEYYYLDSTPTHSYMKALYKYPQREFPYADLAEKNRGLSRHDREYELADSGAFAANRYFDVLAEYAKASPNDVLIRITVHNRGPDAAELHVLPTLWFRNTWSWGATHEGSWDRPWMGMSTGGSVLTSHHHSSFPQFLWKPGPGPDGQQPAVLFTDNDTNTQRLYNSPSDRPHVKDAFHEYVIAGNTGAVNPRQMGTKAAAHYKLNIGAGQSVTLKLRLHPSGEESEPAPQIPFDGAFDKVFDRRIAEAEEFYGEKIPKGLTADERCVARQAYAGLLWTKQFYHYVVEDWLRGDPAQPAPPEQRRQGRNWDWPHLFSRDVISMPDKWEYPWFAAWDLAFHMVAFAQIDPLFAKEQLVLMLREWYMHPNGQIPAYEFAFGDVNPPVHAWACWRVYKMTAPRGERDLAFLASAFQKLLINFTWWVNRKDPRGAHLFSGGFLGLDNIGVFDRSRPLPTGGYLEQADGTAWMAFYCGTMLSMALELARHDPGGYEDMASKFFEHFVAIIDAMNTLGGSGLWNEGDGFYYDQLMLHGDSIPLRVRSLVGIIPLFAVEVLEESVIDKLPGFRKRLEWFLKYREDLAKYIVYQRDEPGKAGKKDASSSRGGAPSDARPSNRLALLAVPPADRLKRVLGYLLDEEEFLSPHGVRSLSRIHRDHPYVFRDGSEEHRVEYCPGESNTWIFGGNSNWRGPIWFPLNYLLVEALDRYHYYYKDTLRVELPTGSGEQMNLAEVAAELRKRLVSIFLRDKSGARPCHAEDARYRDDPHFRDLVLFYEYFHGDTGRGLGAPHQTGWTALAATMMYNLGRMRTAHEIGKL